MWLLTTKGPVELVSIPEQDLDALDPSTGKRQIPYAILSHTWEKDNEEVSFEEVQAGQIHTERAGGRKMQFARLQAARDRYEYIWIDTCCIDKKSSAELQEAINSMYYWYQRAAVCYAYLRDASVETMEKYDEDNAETESDADSDVAIHFKDMDKTSAEDPLRKCRWWSRGWTLQELIAPKVVIFFDKKWRELGSKKSLCRRISTITGIQMGVLTGEREPRSYTIAQRMSWAAKRKTSRIEDRAYSLLGLFDTHLPLIYGERGRAFLRLQEEIIKYNDDPSIFAWREEGPPEHVGMLASDINAFRHCQKVYLNGRSSGLTFSMTNKGLSIRTKLIPWSQDTFLAPLSCIYAPYSRLPYYGMGICLKRWDAANEYIRVSVVDGADCHLDRDIDHISTPIRSIVIRQRPLPERVAYQKMHGYDVKIIPSNMECMPILATRGQDLIAHHRTCASPYPVEVYKVRNDQTQLWVSFGFDPDWNPCIIVVTKAQQLFTEAIGRSEGDEVVSILRTSSSRSNRPLSQQGPSVSVKFRGLAKFNMQEYPFFQEQGDGMHLLMEQRIHADAPYWAGRGRWTREENQACFAIMSAQLHGGVALYVNIHRRHNGSFDLTLSSLPTVLLAGQSNSSLPSE